MRPLIFRGSLFEAAGVPKITPVIDGGGPLTGWPKAASVAISSLAARFCGRKTA
jgi:hypothetical protein